jgi:hypothetical protein
MNLPPGLSHIMTSSGQRVRSVPRKPSSLLQLLFILASQAERLQSELSALGARAQAARQRLGEIERDEARLLELARSKIGACSGSGGEAPHRHD